ncbi:MAG: enoyl-CoA hydratase [Myxococcales bacterium]|nr:enoyl-CoA hydratase [Myxococcales bacterium]
MRARTERRGRVFVITMCREDKRNAIDAEMTAALDGALNELDDDPELWVGILSGGARYFSAGTDMKKMSGEPTPRGGEYGIIRRRRTKPLIAAVEGLAFGGGFETALACDIIVAAEDARFGLPEVKRGLLPTSGGIFRAPRHLPVNVAKEMILTGEPVSAARLERLGVVNRMVAAGEALEEALRVADAIVANSPVAVQQSLQAIDRVISENDGLGWQATAEARSVMEKSEDRREGVAAFFERRAPSWPGR